MGRKLSATREVRRRSRRNAKNARRATAQKRATKRGDAPSARRARVGKKRGNPFARSPRCLARPRAYNALAAKEARRKRSRPRSRQAEEPRPQTRQRDIYSPPALQERRDKSIRLLGARSQREQAARASDDKTRGQVARQGGQTTRPSACVLQRNTKQAQHGHASRSGKTALASRLRRKRGRLHTGRPEKRHVGAPAAKETAHKPPKDTRTADTCPRNARIH